MHTYITSRDGVERRDRRIENAVSTVYGCICSDVSSMSSTRFSGKHVAMGVQTPHSPNVKTPEEFEFSLSFNSSAAGAASSPRPLRQRRRECVDLRPSRCRQDPLGDRAGRAAFETGHSMLFTSATAPARQIGERGDERVTQLPEIRQDYLQSTLNLSLLGSSTRREAYGLPTTLRLAEMAQTLGSQQKRFRRESLEISSTAAEQLAPPRSRSGSLVPGQRRVHEHEPRHDLRCRAVVCWR